MTTQKLKYGVISIDAHCRDLLDWETLYISGRMQKPVCRCLAVSHDTTDKYRKQVRILQDDFRVRLANQVNLASAFRTALLLLPEQFTEIQFYETIAGLSYQGDFRMAVGENPFKVRNIVSAQLNSFRSLYGGLMKSFWRSITVLPGIGDDGMRTIRQDKSARQHGLVASKLPIGLRGKVLSHYQAKWNLQKALQVDTPNAGRIESTAVGVETEKVALWQRIVQDDEFVAVVSKSESVLLLIHCTGGDTDGIEYN